MENYKLKFKNEQENKKIKLVESAFICVLLLGHGSFVIFVFFVVQK